MCCLESCGAIPLPLSEDPATSEVHSVELVIVEVVDGSNTVGFLEKGRIKKF